MTDVNLQKRIEEINSSRVFYLLGIATVVSLMGVIEYLIFKYPFENILLAFVVPVFVLFIGMFLISFFLDSYRREYYELILKPVLEKYGINYEPDMGLSENIVVLSGLIPHYDIYTSKDYIEGENFLSAYVILKNEYIEEEENGTTRKEQRVVWEGTIMVYFSERVVNNPFIIKMATPHLSDFLPFIIDKNRIKLDDPEFEKVFDVIGGDSIEVRKFLTHDVMRKLVQLKREQDFTAMSFVYDYRFVSLVNFSAIRYPNILRKVKEKTIDWSIRGVFKLIAIANFFEENNL